MTWTALFAGIAICVSFAALYQQYLKRFSLSVLMSPALVFRGVGVQDSGSDERTVVLYMIAGVSLTNRGAQGGAVRSLAIRMAREEDEKDYRVFFARSLMRSDLGKHPSLIDPIRDSQVYFAGQYLAGHETKELYLRSEGPPVENNGETETFVRPWIRLVPLYFATCRIQERY